MRLMGVREYAGAMAGAGMPCGLTRLPVIWERYVKPTGRIGWRVIVVRALTVAEIGLMLCGRKAVRRRESRRTIALTSRKRNHL